LAKERGSSRIEYPSQPLPAFLLSGVPVGPVVLGVLDASRLLLGSPLGLFYGCLPGCGFVSRILLLLGSAAAKDSVGYSAGYLVGHPVLQGICECLLCAVPRRRRGWLGLRLRALGIHILHWRWPLDFLPRHFFELAQCGLALEAARVERWSWVVVESRPTLGRAVERPEHYARDRKR
jgi:hypothetical protein